MITRYGAWLDGVGLDEIDPTVFILDIQEQLPQSKITTEDWAGTRDGTRFVREKTLTTSVVVRFAVREYDVARRKAVVSDVAAWARKGSVLTINDRPGQRLLVRCTALPVVASALKWTDTLSVTFTAYAWPFWEDEVEASATLSGKTYETLSLMVPGNGGYALLSGRLSFSGISTVEIVAGDTRFEVQNVTGDLHWGYENGLLFIRSGGESVMAHRTPDSSDDLIVVPGQRNDITISSTAAASGRVYTRGCYL